MAVRHRVQRSNNPGGRPGVAVLQTLIFPNKLRVGGGVSAATSYCRFVHAVRLFKMLSKRAFLCVSRGGPSKTYSCSGSDSSASLVYVSWAANHPSEPLPRKPRAQTGSRTECRSSQSQTGPWYGKNFLKVVLLCKPLQVACILANASQKKMGGVVVSAPPMLIPPGREKSKKFV